jgi:hypothetical protein
MPPLPLTPYAQKILSDWLREHQDVRAITTRVVSKPPDDRHTPWVQVRQLDGPNATPLPVEHLIAFLMQFDCYAGEANGVPAGTPGSTGGEPEAILLGRTVRAVLVDAQDRTLGGAVVTSVRITGDTDVPDTAFEPVRPRRVLTAVVHMHRARGA